MKFSDVFVSREDRYSIGAELDSGGHYVSIPVSNGVVDYEEYYAISAEQSEVFLADRTAQSSSSRPVGSTGTTIC